MIIHQLARWSGAAIGDRTAVVIASFVFVAFASSVGPLFLSAGNIENVCRQISLDAPVAFGETIVLIAGGIDISVGAVMAMAASLAIGLQPNGAGLATFTALSFGLGAGLLNGLLVAKGRIVPFVSTLGTMSLVRGLLLTYTRQQPLVGENVAFTWWGGGGIGPVPTPFVVALLLAALLGVFLTRTRAGRNLYATGGSSEAAHLAGISVERSQLLAFAIAGFLSAVSGVLVASRLSSASVQLGNDTPLLAISAALIGGASLLGGRGGVLGAFFGVLALGMLTNGMDLLGVHTYVQIAVRAVVLIGVVVVDALARSFGAARAAQSKANDEP
jgi:ribose transport system permease protein